MPSHIEEDFRFATFVEVANYSTADLVWKPHMVGFEFSQLLDQLDGQVIASNQAGRLFRGLLKAPGGTALWLAKHLSSHDCENELLITTEPECSDPLLLSELCNLENVVDATEDAGDLQRFEQYDSIDCSVLACRVGLLDQFRLIESNPRLRRKPIIAYDPERALASEAKGRGRYFMNSAIWVCDNGN